MTAAVSLPSFALRLETPEDRHYILSTWRRSEKEASGHLEGARFAGLQDGAMHAILARPSTVVSIVYPAGTPEVIAAWLVARPPVPVIHKGPGRWTGQTGPAPIVYFVFVREEGRSLGLARMLLAEMSDRKDTLYTTKPARKRGANGGWEPSGLPIPRSWTYCPRAAFVEVQ